MRFKSLWLRPLSFIILMTLLSAAPVWAHTYWLQPLETGAKLLLGDSADDESYEEDDVVESGALDSNGQKLPLERTFSHGRMTLTAPGAKVLWIKSDYGFWRKTHRGWSPGSKSSPGRTIDSNWHIQYAKLVRGRLPGARAGMELEIVVESIGEGKISGLVLFQGKPMSTAPLYIGHKKVARTDGQGRFNFRSGDLNFVLSTTIQQPLDGHPEVDNQVLSSSYTYQAPESGER